MEAIGGKQEKANLGPRGPLTKKEKAKPAVNLSGVLAVKEREEGKNFVTTYSLCLTLSLVPVYLDYIILEVKFLKSKFSEVS